MNGDIEGSISIAHAHVMDRLYDEGWCINKVNRIGRDNNTATGYFYA